MPPRQKTQTSASASDAPAESLTPEALAAAIEEAMGLAPEAAVPADPEAPAAPADEVVLFRTAREENFAFQVNGIMPEREAVASRFYVWRIPAAAADLFGQHFHVQTGRVVRVK